MVLASIGAGLLPRHTVLAKQMHTLSIVCFANIAATEDDDRQKYVPYMVTYAR